MNISEEAMQLLMTYKTFKLNYENTKNQSEHMAKEADEIYLPVIRLITHKLADQLLSEME